jgi:hypothetical protein
VSNTYAVTPATTSPAPYFVYLTRSDVTGADCDGTALPPSRTAYTYDAYGNPTDILTTIYTATIGGTVSSTSETANTYSNDTTNWLFLLTQTAVTNTKSRFILTATDPYSHSES